MGPLKIWTIGHGTRPVQELASMLEGAGVQLLIDVRWQIRLPCEGLPINGKAKRWAAFASRVRIRATRDCGTNRFVATRTTWSPGSLPLRPVG